MNHYLVDYNFHKFNRKCYSKLKKKILFHTDLLHSFRKQLDFPSQIAFELNITLELDPNFKQYINDLAWDPYYEQ